MSWDLAPLLAKPGLLLGHYVGEFVTPGIGHILKEAGAEFVFLDMEHSGNSFETINRGLRYFEAAGVPAMVRVPSDAYDHIARALDIGAEGIIVPMLGSAEQARAIIEKLKYTPVGKRGLGLGLGNDRYRMMPAADALKAANARTRFVALIETVDGVEERRQDRRARRCRRAVGRARRPHRVDGHPRPVRPSRLQARARPRGEGAARRTASGSAGW